MNKPRDIVVLVLFCLLLLGATPWVSPITLGETVSFNTKSLIYHCPSCRWAKKCTRNCISVTIEQAKAGGGRACKVCGGTCIKEVSDGRDT